MFLRLCLRTYLVALCQSKLDGIFRDPLERLGPHFTKPRAVALSIQASEKLGLRTLRVSERLPRENWESLMIDHPYDSHPNTKAIDQVAKSLRAC